MTPPVVLEFKVAVDDLLETSKPRFKEHLTILFERQSDKLVKNRDAFESFLLRNGLTPVQTNGVMERIMVATSQQPLGQGIQTVQVPGLGYVHILQPGQSQGPQGQPIILQAPGGAPGQSAEQARLESHIEKLEEKISALAGGGGGQPPMRRGNRVVFDKEGNVLTDHEGNIVSETLSIPGSRCLTELRNWPMTSSDNPCVFIFWTACW
ncbi:unnamed protein product, partial [marine sediment metagenome]